MNQTSPAGASAPGTGSAPGSTTTPSSGSAPGSTTTPSTGSAPSTTGTTSTTTGITTTAPDGQPTPDAGLHTTRRPHRKAALIWGGLAAVALGAGGATVAALLSPAQHEAALRLPEASTVQVTSGDLTSHTTARGKLQFATQASIVATTSGIVTEVAAPGTLLEPGAVAYRVDAKPVVMLAGSMPAWRDFAAGMEPGVDVEQLEQNLLAFGHLTVTPSHDFNWYTKWAVRAWTESLGLKPQDSLSKDQVIFTPQPLRVSAASKQVGDRVAAGDTIFTAAGTTKEVVAQLSPAAAELAPVGTAVSIELPNGVATTGKVVRVGAAEEAQSGQGGQGAQGSQGGQGSDSAASGELVIPVFIALDDQAAAEGLSLVSVKLGFGEVLREGVLTVPVDALVPLDDTAFAVELPRRSANAERELIPVEVGAFASGTVEISGKGVRAGLEVTVPKR